MVVGGVTLSAVAIAVAVFLVNYEPTPDTGEWLIRMFGMGTIFAPMQLAIGLALLVLGLSIGGNSGTAAATQQPNPVESSVSSSEDTVDDNPSTDPEPD
jgi:hypothetical protein